jgi:ribosome-associated protein YbcJ (S4-like RNA binding protein)
MAKGWESNGKVRIIKDKKIRKGNCIKITEDSLQ